MLIEEMTRQASLDLLARARLGRLACAQGLQPYVVPFYFAYQDYSLYSFTTVGQKIEWMRANPLVCVEADEVVNSQEWMSVIVFGRYEELPDTPERQVRARIRPEITATLCHVVGAWFGEDNPPRHRAPASTGLLPHPRRSNYRPSRLC